MTLPAASCEYTTSLLFILRWRHYYFAAAPLFMMPRGLRRLLLIFSPSLRFRHAMPFDGDMPLMFERYYYAVERAIFCCAACQHMRYYAAALFFMLRHYTPCLTPDYWRFAAIFFFRYFRCQHYMMPMLRQRHV